mgnify:CR=1 FL=1|jgi:hypothetical protein|tara:strand:+ start:13 stop:126 length:114 start_codon:yes stop_codon:yes gene_type:complete
MAKRLATVFSSSIGNTWHGKVKPDTRRKLNLKKKVKK